MLAKIFLKLRKLLINDKHITDEQYKLLEESLDEFLLSYRNNSIIAIKFLHVLRGSPKVLDKYKVLFEKNIYLIIYDRCCGIVKNVIFFFYSIFKSFYYRNPDIVHIENGIDFLFVSHFTGKSNLENYSDPYFEDLILHLSQNKRSVFVAYINHTKHRNLVTKNYSVNTVFLEKMVSIREILNIYTNIMRSFIYIKKDINNKLSSSISLFTKINLFSSSTINNLIIANQVGDLVDRLSPKYVVTTYEGHAWERLVFHVSKKMNKGVKCIAYQHAPIFKYQHAIKRGVGGDYDPDLILTTGLISKRQLEKSDKLNNSRIIVLGSSRHINATVKNYKNKNTCLVVPEGEISECLILFKFALTYALKNKHIDFIFRFPPMVDINSLVKLDSDFLNISSNISISRHKLLDDILISDTVLYRGSSVVINCVSLGLRPIYLKLNNELTIDPLYEVEHGKEVVSSHKEFTNALSRKVANKDVEKLVKYCKDMYAPLNYKVLENLVLGS